MDDQTMVVPFSNGTEAGYWHERNCEQCSKYEMESESEEEAGCKLAFNIDLGFMAGGIPLWVAERIGRKPKGLLIAAGCRFVSLKNRCEEWVNGKEK